MFYGRNIFSLPLQAKINKIRFTCIYNKVRNEEENVFVDGTHDGVDGNECPDSGKSSVEKGIENFAKSMTIGGTIRSI